MAESPGLPGRKRFRDEGEIQLGEGSSNDSLKLGIYFFLRLAGARWLRCFRPSRGVAKRHQVFPECVFTVVRSHPLGGIFQLSVVLTRAGDSLTFSDTLMALQMMRAQFPKIDKVFG